MSIKFTCSCGKRLRARDEIARCRSFCPRCGQPVGIPSLEGNQPGTTAAPLTPAERVHLAGQRKAAAPAESAAVEPPQRRVSTRHPKRTGTAGICGPDAAGPGHGAAEVIGQGQRALPGDALVSFPPLSISRLAVVGRPRPAADAARRGCRRAGPLPPGGAEHGTRRRAGCRAWPASCLSCAAALRATFWDVCCVRRPGATCPPTSGPATPSSAP